MQMPYELIYMRCPLSDVVNFYQTSHQIVSAQDSENVNIQR